MEAIASIVLKATIFLLLAFVATALARRVRASARHLMYATAFIALLLLPLAERFVPATPLPLLKSPLQQTAAPASERAVRERPLTVGASPATVTALPDSTRYGTTSPVSSAWNAIAALRNLYVSGVAVLLALMCAGIWRLRSSSRAAAVWPAGSAIAARIARETHLTRRVNVVLSDDLTVPLTFGFRRPVIVMPVTATGWDDDAIHDALQHELEHIRRGDWLMQIAARIACALYWPHPLVWVAWHRFCLEAERACDDAVVTTSDPSSYAEQLVMLARSIRKHSIVPALQMASPSRLAERVHAILDTTQSRGRTSRALTFFTTAVAVTLVMMFGSLRVVAAQGPAEDAASRRPKVQEQAGASPAAGGGKAQDVPRRSAANPPDGTRDEIVQEAVSAAEMAAAMHRAFEPDAYSDGIAGALADPDLYRDAIAGTLADGDTYHDAYHDSIVAAARAGDSDSLERLFSLSRLDINTSFPGDGTALLIAAGARRSPTVQWLLNRGADPNVHSPGDGNPLIAAARSNATAVIAMLLDRGARIDEVVPGDENALIAAAADGHEEAVRLLVARGADVNARVRANGREWRSPLSMARRGGHEDIVKILTEAGARD